MPARTEAEYALCANSGGALAMASSSASTLPPRSDQIGISSLPRLAVGLSGAACATGARCTRLVRMYIPAAYFARRRSGRIRRLPAHPPMPKPATLALVVALATPLLANAQRPAPDALGGLPRHATLGVAIAPDSAAPARRGVVVQAVTPTGTAAAAGVKPGDRLLALNEAPVSDVAAVVARGRRLLTGQPVTFRVRRGESTLEL